MKNGHKTIVAMLAVVAVLLAVNIVTEPRTAEAQVTSEGEPYIVKLLPRSHNIYFRVWSDGRVDHLEPGAEECEFRLTPGQSYGPVEHPFPVTDAIRAMWRDDETDVGSFATEMIRAVESGGDVGEVAERFGTDSGLFDDLLGRMLLRARRCAG